MATVSFRKVKEAHFIIHRFLFFLYSFVSGTIMDSFSRRELSASFSMRATSAPHVGIS